MSVLVTVLAGFVPAFVVNTDAQAFPLHVPCVCQVVTCADQRLVLVEMATSAMGVQSSALAMGRCCCRSLVPVLPSASSPSARVFVSVHISHCIYRGFKSR